MEQLFSAMLAQLMSNPALVQMAIGVVVSLIVAKMKEAFPKIDAAAKDPEKVKWVQLLVAGLSLAATLGTAWASGTLHNVDPKLVSEFLTTLAAAFMAHDLGSSVKKQVQASKNAK